jgi:drug/metabolite transporter (DMT)-like permease
MSVVLPVVAGVWLYGESLGYWGVSGVVLALVAVFLGTYKKEKREGGMSLKTIWLPVVLFLGSGLVDISMKYAEFHWIKPGEEAMFSGLLFASAFIWGLGFSTYQMLRHKRFPKWRDVLWGILLGIPNFGSIYFLLQALDQSGWPSAAIFPVNNVAIVLLSAVIGMVLFREKLTSLNYAGLAAGVLAIILISWG